MKRVQALAESGRGADGGARRGAKWCKMVPNAASTNENELTEAKSLSPRQILAARCMGRGMGIVAVARRLGIHGNTVGRWSQNSEFLAEVQREMNAVMPPARERARPNSKPEQKWVFEGKQFERLEDYLAAIDKATGHRSNGTAGKLA